MASIIIALTKHYLIKTTVTRILFEKTIIESPPSIDYYLDMPCKKSHVRLVQ
jgi:hypothetical protein